MSMRFPPTFSLFTLCLSLSPILCYDGGFIVSVENYCNLAFYSFFFANNLISADFFSLLHHSLTFLICINHHVKIAEMKKCSFVNEIWLRVMQSCLIEEEKGGEMLSASWTITFHALFSLSSDYYRRSLFLSFQLLNDKLFVVMVACAKEYAQNYTLN